MRKIAQVNIGEEFGSPLDELTDVGTLASSILSTAIAIAGVILLILLIFGGISIIAGAGDNDPQRVARGKQAATAAVVGFLLIFGAYWIIQAIELIFGLNILG